MTKRFLCLLLCLILIFALILSGCATGAERQDAHVADAYSEAGVTVIPTLPASQSTIPSPIRLTPMLPAAKNDAPAYEEIRREMLELWENQGTSNPELFVKTAEYQQLNDKFRGAKATNWNGWVISGVTPGFDTGYQGEPGIVKVSMSGPKSNNGEAADVILNQVALEQMQKLDTYRQPDENISPQQIVLTGTITVVLFYGGVALENVEIEPTQ
ncbi:MAG TPA: hypothetical protein VGE45_18905 [Chloroflexia bacterium]